LRTEELEVAGLGVELVGGLTGRRVAVKETTVDEVLENETRRPRVVRSSLSTGEVTASDYEEIKGQPRLKERGRKERKNALA
jgi:hypothetical protein